MTDTKLQQQLMDYLYNEMEENERKKFEIRIAEEPDLRQELNRLRGVRQTVHSASIPEPEEAGFNFPESDPGGGDNVSNRTLKHNTAWLKYLLPVAALLLLTLFLGVFTTVQFGQTDSGYYLTFGNPPEQLNEPRGLTEEEVAVLIQQIREENAVMVNTMLEEVQAEQTEQFNDALMTLAEYYEQRRNRDLLLYAEGLNQLEETTTNRFQQTNRALNGIIYALSNE